MRHISKNQSTQKLLTILLTALLSCSVYAGSLEDGQASFDSGDYKQAFEILKPLAKDSNAEAQNLLGLMFAKGNDDFPINDKKAVFWLRKAAKQGHLRASRNLAFLEANGRGGGDITSTDTADEDDCEE